MGVGQLGGGGGNHVESLKYTMEVVVQCTQVRQDRCNL